MNSVRASAPQLADITPYDPKYLPARAYLSANENPCDVETEVRNEIKREINKVAFNRPLGQRAARHDRRGQRP